MRLQTIFVLICLLVIAACAQTPNGCRSNYARIYVPGANGGAGMVMPVYTGTRCDAGISSRPSESGNSPVEPGAGPIKPGMPGYEDGESDQESGQNDEGDS